MVFLFRQTSSRSDIKKTSQTGGRGLWPPNQIMAHTGQHLTATLWTGGAGTPSLQRLHVRGYPGLPSPPPPRRAPYPPERAYERERESYAVVDYYEKYRARPALYVASQAMEMRGELAPYPHHHPLLPWLGRALRPPLSPGMSVTPSHLCPPTTP